MAYLIAVWIVVLPLLFSPTCFNCETNIGPNRAVKQVWLPFVSGVAP